MKIKTVLFLLVGIMGFVQPIIAETTVSCTAGTTSNGKGCTPCPKGYYCPGGIRAQKCGAGYYADVTGLSECKKCERGTHASGTGNTMCESCSIGTYADEEGTAECKICPDGTYTDEKGVTKCEYCPEGYFCVDGIKTPCQVGEYADETGLSKCKKCPGVTTNSEPGQSSCRERNYKKIKFIYGKDKYDNDLYWSFPEDSVLADEKEIFTENIQIVSK